MEQNKKPDRDGQNPQMRQLALLTVIVSEMISFTGVGVGIGYWAWKHWGAPWWVLLLSSLTGLTLAFYRMYLISNRE